MFNYFHHVYQHLLQSLPISLLQTKRIRTYMKNDPRWRIADRGPRSRTACSENRVGVQRTCSARRSRSSPSVSWAESRARARFTRRKRKDIVFRGMMQEVSVSFMCACGYLGVVVYNCREYLTHVIMSESSREYGEVACKNFMYYY